MIAYLSTLTLVWACGLALYYGLLRRSPGHAASRAFLLSTLAAGLVLPLLPHWGGGPELLPPAAALPRVAWLPAATVVAEASTRAIPTEAWIGLGVLAYLTVGLLFATDIRRLLAVIRSRRRVAEGGVAPGVRIYESPRTEAPFSFGQAVYVSDWSALEPEARRALLHHEAAHIRLGHTIDNLVLAAVCVVLWWHPLAYALRRALRLVHEYQADAAACRRVDPASYRRVLLALQLGVAPSRLVAAFAHSPLQTRFAMMQSSFRQNLFVRPLLAALGLVLVGLACTKDEIDADLLEGVAAANASEELHAAAQAMAMEGMTLIGVDTVEIFDPETYESKVKLIRHYQDGQGNSKYFEQVVGPYTALTAGDLPNDPEGWTQVSATSPDVVMTQSVADESDGEFITGPIGVIDPATGKEEIAVIDRPAWNANEEEPLTSSTATISEALKRWGQDAEMKVVENEVVLREPHTREQHEVKSFMLVNINTGERVLLPPGKSLPMPEAELIRSESVYKIADEMPHFPGCDERLPDEELQTCAQRRMLEFVYKNIKYPEEARREGISGTSVVSFVVGLDGELLEPRVVRDVGGGTKEEVLRMIREMPAWIPGRLDGRDVQVRFNLPIKFKLE